MMKERPFWQSFRDAWEGISYSLKTQRNMRIHVTMATVALLIAWLLDVSRWEWLVLLFAIFLVMVAELLNTAVERTVDLFMSTYHPLAKIAKNVAAGAVLLTALNAIIVGVIIFYEKVIRLLEIIFF